MDEKLNTEALAVFLKKKSSMLNWALSTMSVQDLFQAYVVAGMKFGFEHARAFDYVTEIEERLKASYEEGVDHGYDEGYEEGVEVGKADSYDDFEDDDEDEEDYEPRD